MSLNLLSKNVRKPWLNARVENLKVDGNIDAPSLNIKQEQIRNVDVVFHNDADGTSANSHLKQYFTYDTDADNYKVVSVFQEVSWNLTGNATEIRIEDGFYGVNMFRPQGWEHNCYVGVRYLSGGVPTVINGCYLSISYTGDILIKFPSAMSASGTITILGFSTTFYTNQLP